MKKNFQNFKDESIRLKHWDYRWEAAYFITICTKDRYHFFGEVVNEEMHLNKIGTMAHKFILEIPNHFPFVELGNSIVMPNHTHCVIIINQADGRSNATSPQSNITPPPSKVTSPKNTKPQEEKNEYMSNISPKAGSISTIIRSYKAIVSREARKINPDFKWQSRFHDHIIRTAKAFQNIQNYIVDNPRRWDKDVFNQ